MVNTSGPQTPIGNGQTMNTDAATHWNAMVAEIKRDTGIVIVATEGTRSYARQEYLYNNRNKPGFNPAWPPTSPYAYHLSGRAVDVGSSVGYVNTNNARVFRAYSGKYGFRETVKGEPWHFEWRSDWVNPGVNLAASSAKPIPAKPEPPVNGLEASLVAAKDTITLYEGPGPRYFIGGSRFLDIGNSNGTGLDGQLQVETLIALGVPHQRLSSQAEYDRARIMWAASK